MVIYLSFNQNTSECKYGSIAYAAPCRYDQCGRPIAGFINICKSYLDNMNNWDQCVQIMLHEMTQNNVWNRNVTPPNGHYTKFNQKQ